MEINRDALVSMLNSDNEDDISLAVGIVNEIESNKDILNKLWNDKNSIKWHKSSIAWPSNKTYYFRIDGKGKTLKISK